MIIYSQCSPSYPLHVAAAHFSLYINIFNANYDQYSQILITITCRGGTTTTTQSLQWSLGSSSQHSPVAKVDLPEVGSVGLGDPELVAGKQSAGEEGLQLTEHVREDETELGQVAAVVAVLVKHLLLALLEQLDGLLALADEVVDEHAEVLVPVQQVHLVLVLAVDQAQPLVRVRQDVQDEGRAVLQVHLGLLAQLHHLVHQLPRLLEGLLVRRQLLGATRIGEGALQFGQDRGDVLRLLQSGPAGGHRQAESSCTALYLGAPLKTSISL